jgi:hypothetical protein
LAEVCQKILIFKFWTHGSPLVKGLGYKPECRRFENR